VQRAMSDVRTRGSLLSLSKYPLPYPSPHGGGRFGVPTKGRERAVLVIR
jgi:hypothetical protein